MAIVLPAGDEYTWTLRIPENALPGRYRVRKHVQTETGGQIVTAEVQVLAPA